MATKNRISLLKEDRVWSLREQGYDYDSIARIVNCAPNSCTSVLRRVRRRPPIDVDPVRRGRRAGWMSDSLIDDIRQRRDHGETLLSIAKDYHVDSATIWAIANYRTYVTPEEPYPFSFSNRLHSHESARHLGRR